MKFWILEPTDEGYDNKGLDGFSCFVVRAKSEESAREFVSQKSCDEGPDFWKDGRTVSCYELKCDGEEEIILKSSADMFF